MAAKPSELVDFESIDRIDQNLALELIFGPEAGRRFTQDTPVLPEVWLTYAVNPGRPIDLLLTPFQKSASGLTTPGRIAREIRRQFGAADGEGRLGEIELTYNLSTVVAKLRFDELVRIVLPMSRWWQKHVVDEAEDGAPGADPPREPLLEQFTTGPKRAALAGDLERSERMLREGGLFDPSHRLRYPPDVLWMVRIVGIINLMAREAKAPEKAAASRTPKAPAEGPIRLREALKRTRKKDGSVDHKRVVEAAAELLKDLGGRTEPEDPDDPFPGPPRIYSVSLNRMARLGLFRSRAVVKADAAERVFEISCSRLNWAVIDAGIDARHDAFRKSRNGTYPPDAFEASPRRNNTRIVDTIDFTISRSVTTILGDLSFDSLLPAPGTANYEDTARATLVGKLMDRWEALPSEVRDRLTRPGMRSTVTLLSDCFRDGRTIDWYLLGLLLRVPHGPKTYRTPGLDHGTHVAGIIAADWHDGMPLVDGEKVRGICPDLNLYDLRTFSADPFDQEFNIMSAIQYVRSLNASQKEVMVIHGVNLSFSLRHAVDNYACGRTPICMECDRLSSSGVVVVAAAGNYGYRREGAIANLNDTYRTVSITDPGNADAVITVGSTHREEPHNYGVSYFSSRGPTADGRRKPDLIAPGEKIVAPVPGTGDGYRSMDGTSMAAPHVSGVAALLMARNPELIGRPERIKQILCETATDLGRDRYFQGHGLIDTLRALQSV
jgi:hypothetical protein